jgi:hypothetical protein
MDADWEVIKYKIIEIDKFLYKNKISAIGINLKDLMILKVKKFIFMILNIQF